MLPTVGFWLIGAHTYGHDMAGVTVHIDIPAPRQAVWDEVAVLERHVEWMADAESIEFLGDQQAGTGTRMEVATRFGPFRTKDVMVFTEWDAPVRMAVEHTGLFTGTGAFTLDETPAGTRFTWSERITFPWWLGGPIGAWFAQPIFGWVWRRNLRRLAARFPSAG